MCIACHKHEFNIKRISTYDERGRRVITLAKSAFLRRSAYDLDAGATESSFAGHHDSFRDTPDPLWLWQESGIP
jgi:hypothetical protein